MFARGRHFNVKTFANNDCSAQDTDLKLCYNIKVTSQVLQDTGLLKQNTETLRCGSSKQYIIWLIWNTNLIFLCVYLQGSITFKVQI